MKKLLSAVLLIPLLLFTGCTELGLSGILTSSDPTLYLQEPTDDAVPVRISGTEGEPYTLTENYFVTQETIQGATFSRFRVYRLSDGALTATHVAEQFLTYTAWNGTVPDLYCYRSSDTYTLCSADGGISRSCETAPVRLNIDYLYFDGTVFRISASGLTETEKTLLDSYPAYTHRFSDYSYILADSSVEIYNRQNQLLLSFRSSSDLMLSMLLPNGSVLIQEQRFVSSTSPYNLSTPAGYIQADTYLLNPARQSTTSQQTTFLLTEVSNRGDRDAAYFAAPVTSLCSLCEITDGVADPDRAYLAYLTNDLTIRKIFPAPLSEYTLAEIRPFGDFFLFNDTLVANKVGKHVFDLSYALGYTHTYIISQQGIYSFSEIPAFITDFNGYSYAGTFGDLLLFENEEGLFVFDGTFRPVNDSVGESWQETILDGRYAAISRTDGSFRLVDSSLQTVMVCTSYTVKTYNSHMVCTMLLADGSTYYYIL